MDMEVMEAVLLSTQLVPLTVDVPSGVSVERDLLMLMPTDMEVMEVTVMEVVLPSIQLVPHMLPEAHKDSVESNLLNHGDSTTTLFPETHSFVNPVSVTTQEVFSAVNQFL